MKLLKFVNDKLWILCAAAVLLVAAQRFFLKPVVAQVRAVLTQSLD